MVAMNEHSSDEARWKRHAAVQTAWWTKRAASLQEESLRQNNLMYGALIAIGAVFVQPFLTSGRASLDLSAQICVFAFSLAIPLLSALMLLNRQETYRRRSAASVFVMVSQQVALGLGFAGVVAGFWHIMPAAGIVLLVGALLGVAVHGAGYVRVEQDDAQATGDVPATQQPPQPSP